MTDPTPPDGCTHCGLAQRDHARRWTQAAGWHQWTAPTDAQRLQRMRARRTQTTTTTTKETP